MIRSDNILNNVKLKRMLSKSIPYICAIPLIWILIAFIVYPTWNTLLASLGGADSLTLKYYKEFFDLKNNVNIQALWHSLYISFVSVFYCGIVGTALAFFINKFDFPGRNFFSTCATLPLILPALVGVIAFIFLYGESGFITKGIQFLFKLDKVPFSIKGVTGIILVHVYTQYVYFYLNVSSALKGLDPALEEAAYNLGASRFYVFRKVTLPMLTPALVASSLLVFMTSMASFSAPFLLAGNYRVLSTQIFISKLNGGMELAATQALILSFFSILFLVFMRWYESLRNYTLSTKGVSIHRSEVRNSLIKFLFIFSSILIVLILILPPLVIILISFVPEGTWTYQIYPTTFGLQNYELLFKNPAVFKPILNSFKMASLATLGNLIIGVLASYMIVKSKIKGKGFLDLMVMIPWALPSTVVAINLILAFNKRSVFSFDQILVGTFWILPLAYFIKHLPIVVRSTNASLAQLDNSVEEAARNLGASWLYAFRKVVFPLIWPGVLSGVLLSFVTACGEFTSSVMLYIFSNKPISIEITAQMDQFNMGQASAYGVIQIILITLVVALSNKLGRSQNTVI